MISSHGFSSHSVLFPLLDYSQLASNNEDSTYSKEEAVRHCCNFLTQNSSKLPHSSQNLVKPPVTCSIIPVIEPTHPSRMKHETCLNNTFLNNQTLELIYVKGKIKVQHFNHHQEFDLII